jgi:hypothetical protein
MTRLSWLGAQSCPHYELIAVPSFHSRLQGAEIDTTRNARVGSMSILGRDSYVSVRFVAVSDRLPLVAGQERGRSPLPVRRFGACYHHPQRAPDRTVSRHPAW